MNFSSPSPHIRTLPAKDRQQHDKSCATATAMLLLLAAATLLNADGGVVQFRKEAGPFLVTLFSSPSPLHAGPADVSVLVESAQNRTPVLDASVSLRFRTENGQQTTAAATHEQATNKLLYAALPTISEPGTCRVQVTVARGSDRVVVTGEIQVLAGAPVFFHYWPYFAIVPCLVGLFILNQYLKAKQNGKGQAA